MLLVLALLGSLEVDTVPEWLQSHGSEVGGFARGEHGWVSWSASTPVRPPAGAPAALHLTPAGSCGKFRLLASPRFVVAVHPHDHRWQLVDALSTEDVERVSAECEDGVIVVEVRRVRDRSTDPFDTGWATPTRFVVCDPTARLHVDVSFTQSADSPGPTPEVVRALLDETRTIVPRLRPRSGFTDHVGRIYERLDR